MDGLGPELERTGEAILIENEYESMSITTHTQAEDGIRDNVE